MFIFQKITLFASLTLISFLQTASNETQHSSPITQQSPGHYTIQFNPGGSTLMLQEGAARPRNLEQFYNEETTDQEALFSARIAPAHALETPEQFTPTGSPHRFTLSIRRENAEQLKKENLCLLEQLGRLTKEIAQLRKVVKKRQKNKFLTHFHHYFVTGLVNVPKKRPIQMETSYSRPEHTCRDQSITDSPLKELFENINPIQSDLQTSGRENRPPYQQEEIVEFDIENDSDF